MHPHFYFCIIMKIKSLLLLLLIANYSIAQPQIKKILFIGNSYTYVNDLPGLLSSVAQSTGDSTIYDSNCIGGYTLQLHSTNSVTLQKIAQSDFDYVVLQEQSQMPSFPISQVQSSVFPYAKTLDSLINVANSCTETVFYMTWGRKNGDAGNCSVWPPVCTYSGMDSLLRLRYLQMANDNNAIVSPVGAVWRYLRNNYPNLELYNADESHPSLAGSYAAACAFYSVIFRKDPTSISYISSLDSIDALTIRNAAKLVAYDSLSFWNVGNYDAHANFTYSISQTSVTFLNQSTNCDSVSWNFGDGTQSSISSPNHVYLHGGNYTITLVGYHCNETDTLATTISLTQVGLQENTENSFNISTISDHGLITIEGNINRIHQIEIYNINGELIYTTNTIQNKIQLNELSNGLYILKAKTDSEVKEMKFVYSKN